ncbi:hypothetical protein AcW1_000282 [Taiwanofungus camphoratus]|nr:hypothetical protein AcW2_001222 [Antrodia cinnamomea]KAI0935891.1 hypothetical protein AcV5_004183 [Antrodia cinnamomea]KAI0963108.1 hypothetical protein AcW1_000282 [Antrodia cinnamomea]
MGTVGQPQRYLPWLWEFPQVILDQSTGAFLSFTLNDESTKIYLDSLIFPVYAAGVSVAVLLLQLIFKSKPVRKLYARFSASEATLMDDSNAEELVVDIGETNEPESSAVGRHIAQLGGLTIFGFKFARFIALLALLGLQIFTAVSENQNPVDSELLRAPEWLQIGLCGVYGYASLLALVSVTAKLGLSRVVTRHLALILFVPWAVYVYRDVFPLMTFTLSPVDGADGALFWSKFAVLTFVAVVVPLLIPRQYIPIDPKNPAAEPNPEQTASILSMALFNFLDKPIIEAYRVPHLPLDKLPQLADYDQADQLVKKSRKHLDPFEVKKEKHLFFGLMSIFYKEYLVLVLMITIEDIAGFASPVAIERLLHYIETDGEDALVRPWVWILVLLFGPIVSSVALQYYIFNTTRMLVQVQGIITQLIFDHALRIRVKAEASETPAPSTVSTAVPTPDNASIIEASGSQDPHRSPTTSEEDSDTAHASTADASSTKGKQKPKLVSESGDSKKPVEKPAAGGSQGGNLVGKINNLVTTDLQNIINGRDFLYIVVEIPLNTALSVWFLYKILGWSAFVGMAVMVTMFPLPGYIASKIQSVQLDKMKKTDARVQNVTESMNMIRMIKLFGWEPRVTQQILDKREDELHFQKKAKLLELLNGNINYVIPLVTMVATFATYTVIMKESLTASRVFSSIAVFDLLRNQLHGIFNIIPGLIRAKVSLDRVDEFLHKSELLDEFTKKFEDIASELLLPKSEVDSGVIGFRNAAFTWSNDNDGLVTPGTPRTSKRNFTLRIEDELFFKRGHINLIVGPTGSGKTSLLMALLGELHYIPSSPDSFFNLPRAGGVAYAAQESWVQNETIRDNILFGAPFDEERYNKVIDQCGLERDLTLFDAGDKTEVGEKGLTLRYVCVVTCEPASDCELHHQWWSEGAYYFGSCCVLKRGNPSS